MARFKLNFVWKNETPGAVRYQEVDDAGQPRKTDLDGQVIGPLYLRKTALKAAGLKTPDRFTVVIDDIE